MTAAATSSTALKAVTFSLSLIATVGCSSISSPAAPSRTFTVSPELQPAYALLTGNGSPADWAGSSVGTWAAIERGGVEEIVVGDLPANVSAQYDHVRRITIGRTVLDQPKEVVASFIAHELRHADGERHDCSDGVRDSSVRQGAWHVHARVLESYGLAARADAIRQSRFCGK
jgi:hypothetical protein